MAGWASLTTASGADTFQVGKTPPGTFQHLPRGLEGSPTSPMCPVSRGSATGCDRRWPVSPPTAISADTTAVENRRRVYPRLLRTGCRTSPMTRKTESSPRHPGSPGRGGRKHRQSPQPHLRLLHVDTDGLIGHCRWLSPGWQGRRRRKSRWCKGRVGEHHPDERLPGSHMPLVRRRAKAANNTGRAGLANNFRSAVDHCDPFGRRHVGDHDGEGFVPTLLAPPQPIDGLGIAVAAPGDTRRCPDRRSGLGSAQRQQPQRASTTADHSQQAVGCAWYRRLPGSVYFRLRRARRKSAIDVLARSV